ncbi:MAG TPA: OsmC domain/YcaO domain-containing protein, partial [Alcanivorax sp.]|nr:OsmC domain/YcaO domain-containing protein [Alcanivorax sp.]
KLLINLAQGQHEEALERVEAFLQFNDNTVERNLFYRAVSAVLEIILDDELELDDYLRNLRRMYGDDTMDAVLGSVDGSVRFHGLTPTNTRLDGLEKHQRLIESYKKLHAARAARAGINLAG